jgi:hypothetical protein
MPRRHSETELQGRIAARRTREDLRYILFVGLAVGGIVLTCCGALVVPGMIHKLLVWSESRQSGESATDTAMRSVIADPDSFSSVEAVNQHLGSPGQPVSREQLASIDVSGYDKNGFTGWRTLDDYFRTIPQDAAIYAWSLPDRQLYVAFGMDPNFPGHRQLKTVYVDRSGDVAWITTRD